MQLFEIDALELEKLGTGLNVAANFIPQVIVGMNATTAEIVANIAVDLIAEHTPVANEGDPGLQISTDKNIFSDGMGQVIDIIQPSENVRTGYQYAQARAFGFTTRSGEWWTPPEEPPYPQAALYEIEIPLLEQATIVADTALMDIAMLVVR